MKKVLKNLFWVLIIPYALWAKSHCFPPYLSELDIAKSVIEYKLSGGGHVQMMDGNICLKDDDFPFINVSRADEGEGNPPVPQYLVQSRHNFTVMSLKKLKREGGWDFYEVFFTVDAMKNGKKVKLNITIPYMLNLYHDFGEGCVTPDLGGDDIVDAVYQDCYDSVQSYYKQQDGE